MRSFYFSRIFISMEFKTCNKCKVKYSLENFTNTNYVKKDGTKGKSSTCKHCQKKYRQKNKEYWNTMNKKHQKLRRKKTQWEVALELGNKSCSKCNVIKPLNDFYNYKNSKTGKTGRCKSCTDQTRRDWLNTEIGNKKYNKYNAQYFKSRRESSPEFKLATNIRSTISKYAKNGYSGKNNKTWKMLDYTPEELRVHLEDQFTNKMNWGNYGDYWEVEHATPQSWFDLNNPKEIKKCWALKNLYPATVEFNRLKGNRHNLRENQIE